MDEHVTASQPGDRLTALPVELLHHILQFLPPTDIVAIPAVCQALKAFVEGNKKLFQDVYLNVLDTPAKLDLDWEKEVRDVARLEAVCGRSSADEKRPDIDFVYKTVNRLLETAKAAPDGAAANSSRTHAASRNASLLGDLFQADATTREAFIQRSSLFERVRREHRHPNLRSVSNPGSSSNGVLSDADRLRIRQQSAKLHSLFGRPVQTIGRLRSARTYPFACSKVYDLREYTTASRWGPFRADGSDDVDWEKVEAIMVVLGYNINTNPAVARLFTDIFDSCFTGAWSHSYLGSPPADISSLEARDPYGVTGSWYRIVCFLDFNALLSYNFPHADLISSNTPRPALDVKEATRLIVMKIQVTSINPPGPEDGQDLPVVHFRGFSRSLDDSFDANANSSLRGSVRLTREGEVRWTTFSIFHGEERWRSEGIQIGGVRSARGVFGNWFDSEYDVYGPAGPTAFWKAPSGSENDGEMPDDLLITISDIDPHVILAGGDSDEEMDFESSDDDDEDEEDEVPALSVANELPGLLLDAELDVVDLAQEHHHHFEQV